MLARYYPDLLPPPSLPATSDAPPSTPDPNAFDFGAAMNETRVTVDQLLAAGKVDEAEAYMEQRRQVFVAHGYLHPQAESGLFRLLRRLSERIAGRGRQRPDWSGGAGDPRPERLDLRLDRDHARDHHPRQLLAAVKP